MPVGAVSVISPICHRLSAQQPRTILDLGCGSGLWGALLRNYLDLGTTPWVARIIGVEGWAPYRNPVWDAYDHVNVCPIADFLVKSQRQYDAVLFLDVIEHFEKSEGERLLDRIIDRVAPGGSLYVATPAIWMEQGDVYGNSFERHRSLWTVDDFASRGFEILMDGSADAWGNRMLLAVKVKTC